MRDYDREFWLIILTSWSMDDVEDLELYAEVLEKSRSWR